MKSLAYFTVDVEKDLHTHKEKGVTEGLSRLIPLLKKHSIQATFFVTGELLQKQKKIIRDLMLQKHEIGLHSYEHKRLDSLSFVQKQSQIMRAVTAYKKAFHTVPRSFRAPQYSIDAESLQLLEKNRFRYDSSITSGNIFILRHLFSPTIPAKEVLANFFNKTKPFKITRSIWELPRFCPFIGLGGFEIKLLPLPFLYCILLVHRLCGITPHLVFHSWDFIDTKGSLTSALCSSDRFMKRLSFILSYLSQHYTFTPLKKTILNS